MGIAPRNKSNTDFELPGQFFLLCFEKTAQQAAPAIVAIDANGAIDIAAERAQRAAFKDHSVVRFKHLRDHRRASFEFVPKRAQESGDAAVNDSYHRPQVLGDLGGLLERKLRR